MEKNTANDVKVTKKTISPMKRRKANVDRKYCVACGSCMKECPFGAINVINGVYAEVNKDKCVGCSKCVLVCPASTIEIITLGVENSNEN
jgi:ferredoxin